MHRSQIINTVGGSLTSVVLVIIVLTKFTHGAWLVIIAMPVIFLLMKAINRHYSNVAHQLVPDSDARMLPSKVHAIVLVSKVHKPTLRALAFARATRPDVLTALTVNVDDAETRGLQTDWERYDVPVPLTVLESPVPRDHPPGARLREAPSGGHSPREIWSWCSCRSTSSGTGGRTCCTTRARCGCGPGLQFQPGVMITTVPWQLESSVGRDDGSGRRGPAPGRPAARAHRRRVEDTPRG